MKAETNELRQFARYCLTPQILPRLRALGLRLRKFSYAIALILAAARLLPHDHPALRPENAGKYGTVSLLAMAANEVRFQRSDIDRVLVFFAIVTALIILTLQTVVIMASLFIPDAQAAGIFTIEPDAAKRDLVLVFLDQIFGVPGIFNTGTPAVGTPLHAGVHALLGFYAQAMMIIATLIVAYYVVVVVGESAASGQPFGKRFNSLWAPVRLVLALGLLVPLGSGLNAAQYLTLYTAKLGSAFASNAWAVSGVSTNETISA